MKPAFIRFFEGADMSTNLWQSVTFIYEVDTVNCMTSLLRGRESERKQGSLKKR